MSLLTIEAQAAKSAKAAKADRILAQGAREAVDVAQEVIEEARDSTISARDEALNYGSARLFRSWSEASAATFTADEYAMVISTDTGTHTDPVVGGTVNNAGVFRYSSSPAGLERVGDLQGQIAKAWAEGPGEPGGPGTKSAKGHADRAETLADNLNDRLTVIDQPGSSEGGTIALTDGTIVQEYLPNGVAAPAFGTTRQPIVSEDKEYLGEITGSVADNGLRAAAYDEETGALLFGVDEDDQFFCKLAPSVIPPSPSSEEVVAARGTAADLNERLSRALTPAGSAKTSVQNISRLRVLRSALTHLKLGGSALVHIILDGDSWLDSKAYGSTDAITRFYAESGLTNAGPGWIGLGSGQGGGAAIHGTALNNISVTRTGTWTDLFPSASGSPGTPQNFPGYDAARSDANGSIYTVTGSVIGNCTSLTLFCGKGSGIEQSWDGSTWNAVTVTAGSGSTTATIDMTGKSNSLRLRCASGAVVAGLFGLTGSSGVVFSNLSNSGSTAVQKATVQANADYQATLAAFPADAVTVLVQLGLNDTKASTAVDTITDAVGDVVAGYRAAFDGFPSCDIIVACQPNTPQSVQDTLAPLLRVYAEDNDCAFLDWQGFFGPAPSTGDYASYSRDYTSGAASTALPLLEVDTSYRHPSPNSKLVAAGKNAVLSGANLVAGALSGVFLSPFRSN